MTVVNKKLLEENFSIRTTDHPGIVFSVTLEELQNKKMMDDFVVFYGYKIKAVHSDVTATYFCKFYGWVLAGIQYMLSLDSTLNYVLSNIEMQVYYDKEYDYYGLTFKLNDPSTQLCTTPMKRELLEVVYRENVTPLLNAFAEKTSVRMRELWGQISIGLYYGHDNNIKLAASDEQKEKAAEDFLFLTKELQPEIFGSKKNPLDIRFRMIESAREPGVYQRMKPSCCLYYKTEGANLKCYGCPRMTDKEREQRKMEIRARANA